MEARRVRPVFLNLLRIRFPIGAVVSIAHRVSGALVALSLPFLVWAFERSLSNEESYHQIGSMMRSPVGLITSLALCWALAHHVLAGVRHLLMDAGIGTALAIARRTAALVLFVGVLLAAAIFWRLLQ